MDRWSRPFYRPIGLLSRGRSNLGGLRMGLAPDENAETEAPQTLAGRLKLLLMFTTWFSLNVMSPRRDF